MSQRFLLAAVPGLTLALVATLPAQPLDLERAVDGGLATLRDLQREDGSYGDVVSTCQALLAFRGSHRQYTAADGPFVRDAVQWLARRVEQEPLASLAWMRMALEPLPGAAAQAAATRVRQAMEGSSNPSPAPPDLERTGVTGNEPRPPHEVLAALLQEVQAAPSEAVRDAGLRRLPAVLNLLVAGEPTARLSLAGEPRHWASLSGEIVAAVPVRTNAAALAAWCRSLSICHAHAPPPDAGMAGPPEGLRGTRRKRVQDLEAAYPAAAEASLAFLAQQQKDGRFGFQGQADPGITAMALGAVLATCRRLQQERPDYVNAGLDWLRSLQDEQGAIHAGGLKVYVTSAAVLALKESDREQDRAAIARAVEYLKLVQADESEGYSASSDWAYGGIGYGGDLRPDLSNTQFGLEALAAGGVDPKDAAFSRAITFLQRCQNDPEINDQIITRADGRQVQPGTDGGAMYYPGDSKAGLEPQENGQLVARSYGSMTYALLKSYLFSGLPLDDPRVQATVEWIRKNYTVEYNPGFDRKKQPGSEYQGLYYYYFTMAKALDLSALTVVQTPDGQRRPWREDLGLHLLNSGYQEGFWSNQKSARWWEEMPTLATAYTLVALDHCLGVHNPPAGETR